MMQKVVSPTHIEELSALLGERQVLSSREDMIPYGFDGTAAMKQWPRCVVFPRTTEEVVAVVNYAREQGLPIVTRGSGTGLSGGAVPHAHGIVLCLLRMNRVLELDTRNLTMHVETGVITKMVSDRAAEVGLFYPPDPGSMKVSTMGGNVAENSGGLRGLKYGVTRDYVMGLEVVLADGSVAMLGNKCVKDVAGYSLKDLFVGSEGTLGIITKILLKLLPQPAHRQTMMAVYTDMEAAAETVSAIIAAKIIPCTLEFLDRRTIACVDDFAKLGLPRDAGAILVIESDGHPEAVAEEIAAMEKIARDHAAREVKVAADREEAEKLLTTRRAAFPALARLRPTTILEDATVPRSELAKMVRFVEQTAKKYDLMIATFGHMGDGNLHPTFLTDERDEAEMAKVHEAFAEIFEKAIALGGTITGEHGVGTAKKDFLRQQFGAASFALLQAVKNTIDPQNLLNPGKLVDGPTPSPTAPALSRNGTTETAARLS